MRGELKHLQHQLGTTTIYVTHDQAEAMTLANRVAVMRKGKLQQFDNPMKIYEEPANKFVAEFVGSPSMNFIEGRIDFERRTLAHEEMAIDLTESDLARLKASGLQQLTLGIRPEHIRINKTPDLALAARVFVTELMGNETFVFLTLGRIRLIARAASDFQATEETDVGVTFVNNKFHFFNSQTGERI